MDATNDIKARYAAFLAEWGAYVEDGYGETPSLDDFAEAFASVTADDPMTVYRGMAVAPDWGNDAESDLPLGKTWTWDRATAMLYAGAPGGGAILSEGHVAVLLTGTVALSDIDIHETVANHLVAGEGEVTLSDGASIRLLAAEGLEIHPALIGKDHPSIGLEGQSPAPR